MEFVTARISVTIFGLLCQNSVYFATGLAERMDGLAEWMDVLGERFGGLTDVVQLEIRDLHMDLNRNSERLLQAILNLSESIERNFVRGQ